MDAHGRGCDEVAEEIVKILMSWTFKGGRYQNGWGVLERGLCGLAVLAEISGKEQVRDFKAAVETHLSTEAAPQQEVRDRAAREILERAATLHREIYPVSCIEAAIARADHKVLRPLMEDIARILSPSIVR